MTEREMLDVLFALGLQTALLSGLVLSLRLLRPCLLRWFGAGATYCAWLTLPLVLLAQALPASEALAPTVLLRLKARALGDWAASFDGLASLPVEAAMVSGAAGFAQLWLQGLVLLWLLGLLLCLLALLGRHGRLLSRLRFDADAGCWRTPAGTGPALLGLLRPRLCLAEDFEASFSPAEQALILAHEAVHRSRRDNLSLLLASLVCAVHWFNPLAWWALRRLRADQELACDARVLQQAGRAALVPYARALLKAQALLPLSPSSRIPDLACSWQAEHPLMERVLMLKQHHQLPQWRRRLALLLTLGLSLGGAGLVHALKPLPAAAANSPAVPAVTPVQAGYHLVEIDVDLSLNGQLRRALRVQTQQSNWQWLSSDKPGAHSAAGDPPGWMVRVQPTTLAEDRFRLELVILRGDPSALEASGETWRGNLRVVAKPVLVVANGQPARVEVSDDKDGQVLRLDLNTHWVLAADLTIPQPVVDRPQP